MDITFIDFLQHCSEYGELSIIEEERTVPFSIKRVYYISKVPENTRRGFHAHKTLQQVLVCVQGSCKIMLDDGKEKMDISMTQSGKGLLIDSCIWREMYDFTEDAVLLVLASAYYDESDYIRDYDTFLRRLKE